MIIKVRAVSVEDKLERRNEILDAAERLFSERPDGLPSMDELAEAAGVGKGTLYLYFPSKEEVLVELHQRYLNDFFDRLGVALASNPAFSIEHFLDLTRTQVLEHPLRLSLASLVVGLTERSIPPEAALRFKMTLGKRLIEAGERLGRAFGLPAQTCTRLLNVSYGLVLGLWQLKGCMGSERYQHLLEPAIARAFVTEYPTETMEALRTLWTGAAERSGAQGRPS
jgi:AcrR family transcriptional regulator